MKRMANKSVLLLLCLMVFLVLVAAQPQQAATASTIGVRLDGQSLVMDQPPVIVQGRTLVPLRAIMEALDAELSWNATTQTATVLREGTTLILPVNSSRAYVNGQPVDLDVPAQVVGGRLMIPVRFLVEATGGEVDWDAAAGEVLLAVRDEEQKGALRAAKLNRELPTTPPRYTDYSDVQLRLTTPERAALAVNGSLALSGAVTGLSERDVLHVYIAKPDGRARQTTLPLDTLGHFAGTVQFDQGAGEYHVTLQPAAGPDSTRIFNATTLRVHNANTVPRQGVYHHRAYHGSGLHLDLPGDGRLVVSEPLPIKGTAAADLEGRFVWLTVEKDGDRWQTYLAIRDGKLVGEVFLEDGPGSYWVRVALQDQPSGQNYTYITEFGVLNTNPVPMKRSVALLPQGLATGLQFDHFAPAVPDGVLRLSGSVQGDLPEPSLWVTTQRGDQKDNNIHIPVKDGRFDAEIPLALGAGDYTLTVRTPAGRGWYHEAATLWAENQAIQVVHGIRYTAHGRDQELHISEPPMAVNETGARVGLAGTLAADLGDHSYLIAVVKRDDLAARHRIPVVNGRFRGEVWLRFGPGEHQVELYIPKTPSKSYMAASLTLTNLDPEDLRHTAPSFGIEAEDAAIRRLAQDLTADKEPLEAARAVFAWVARNISYDYEKLRSQRVDPDEGAVRTLQTRTGVCRDYAALTVALLRAAGMKAHIVTGKVGAGYGSTGHAWVEVLIGDRWVEMDPTFASGVIIGVTFEPRYDPAYFDPDPLFLAKTHRRDGVQY